MRIASARDGPALRFARRGLEHPMRSIPFRGKSARPAAPSHGEGGKTERPRSRNVVSLASARARLRVRRAGADRAHAPALDPAQLDLEGIDLDRLTTGARQLYWFNLNNYARHLFASAADIAFREGGHAGAPISPSHLREAERKRLGAVRHREALLGAGFLLDALQILGAATCGALATRPEVAGGFGPLALLAALSATIAIFLVREFLYARAES
jgi:hypothetical protein